MALTTAQLNMFLKIAHASGKLIHFDDEDLREYVIVDPAYLIEVLRSIVTEKLFWPKGETLRTIFERLSTTGIIYKSDLLRVWEQRDFMHWSLLTFTFRMATNEARKRYSNAGGIICSVNVYDMYIHLSFPNVSVKGRSVIMHGTRKYSSSVDGGGLPSFSKMSDFGCIIMSNRTRILIMYSLYGHMCIKSLCSHTLRRSDL
jgi:hypothetical protein